MWDSTSERPGRVAAGAPQLQSEPFPRVLLGCMGFYASCCGIVGFYGALCWFVLFGCLVVVLYGLYVWGFVNFRHKGSTSFWSVSFSCRAM